MKKLIILKTNRIVNSEQANKIREQIYNAYDSGILILDKNWSYEVIEFDEIQFSE